MIVRINGNAYELAEKAELKTELKTEFLALMFPVGYVMILASNIDPNKTIGGTWQKIKNGKFLEATEDTGQLKVEVQPGLPDIYGSIPNEVNLGNGDFNGNGAYWDNGNRYRCVVPHFFYWKLNMSNIQFNASRYNPIYGRSSTVQPSSIKVAMWIRVA